MVLGKISHYSVCPLNVYLLALLSSGVISVLVLLFSCLVFSYNSVYVLTLYSVFILCPRSAGLGLRVSILLLLC